MNKYYPIFMDIRGARCLVVGAGQVGARKAKSLAGCGADVAVVGAKVCPDMQTLIDEGKAKLIAELFSPDQLEGVALVFGATDSDEVNQAIYKNGKERNIPVNVVTDLSLCSFIVPSVVRRGDLGIAISASGKSPAVTKRLRKQLEHEFGQEWGVYLDIMGDARETAKQNSSDQKTREKMFNQLADSDLLEKIKLGDTGGAQRLVEEIVGR